MSMRRSIVAMLALALGVPVAAAQEAPCAPVPGDDDACEAWADLFEDFGPSGFGTWYQRPMIVAGEAAVFSTGAYINPQTGIDPIVTVAYDAATGARRWVSRYEGPEEGGEAYPWDAALAPDGRTLYVAGSHTTAPPSRMISGVVVAFDADDGSIRWVTSTGAGRLRAVDVSPDGGAVYAAGRAGTDLFIAGLDPATGTIGWSDTYDGPESAGDEALDLAISPDGERLVVTGQRDYRADWQIQREWGDIVTLAYDIEQRSREWVASHDGPLGGRDTPAGIAVSGDGSRVVVAGTQDSAVMEGRYADDIVVLAYDAATGGIAWSVSRDGPASSLDWAESVGASPTGDLVFVTGALTTLEAANPEHDLSVEQAMVTTALRVSDGSEAWTTVLDTPGRLTEIGRDLAVAPGGERLYVTAMSGPLWAGAGVGSQTLSDLPVDAATIAYDTADGTQEWVARYNAATTGSDPVRPSSMAVAPDGSRVFVLASVNTPVFNPAAKRRTAAYATLAYDA